MKLKAKLAGIVLAAATTFAATVSAEDWAPKGPLMFQIGFGAGGSTDAMGRVIAKVMEEQTGWNVVVENKAGAGGVAMFTGISKSKPNGQVIGMGVSTPILMQLVMRPEQLPFDADSFDYLSSVAKGQLALVANANAPFDDLESMVDYAKANGPMTVAINASPHKLVLAAIGRETGAEFEFVPTDGGAESMKLLLGGQVMASFAGGSHGPYLDSGDMKMIAVANAERHDYAPDVKTVAEQGYGVSLDSYFYIATTKGTDQAILDALSNAISSALATDEVDEIVRNAAKASVLDLSPEETRSMMVDGMPVMEKLVGK
ncbi:MAG: tripartite tricarboxylate transporter substrate binding protein [Alphaproteobacteria bacterium]